jgi:hypothetical protein
VRAWQALLVSSTRLAPCLALALALACDRGKVQEKQGAPVAAPSVSALPVTLSAKLDFPEPERLVAIGDLHGDLDHARRALRLAGAIDATGHWTGGRLVVVQTGDEIDRGDGDRAILDLVEDLKKQAAAAGGALVALLGNHEIMNASLDFRYVTPGGFAAFAAMPGDDTRFAATTSAEQRGRAAAFAPGGPYAALLARRPIVARVGDSVFVHGGVLPKHVAYGLDRMNDQVDDWLLGRRPAPPSIVTAEDGPVWTRAYSSEDGEADCADLTRVLQQLGGKRMVVGHTVQHRGATSACGGAVWRIDVGMSHAFGGPIEALELRGDHAEVLREPGVP